jgi:hypothetical protein
MSPAWSAATPSINPPCDELRSVVTARKPCRQGRDRVEPLRFVAESSGFEGGGRRDHRGPRVVHGRRLRGVQVERHRSGRLPAKERDLASGAGSRRRELALDRSRAVEERERASKSPPRRASSPGRTSHAPPMHRERRPGCCGRSSSASRSSVSAQRCPRGTEAAMP